MQERDFQTEFCRWVKYRHNLTGAFELKLTKEKSLPFSAVKTHQVTALLNANKNHLIYKIPDDSFSQKPFDCFCLAEQPAWVVVMFYRRGQKEFFMIHINAWMEEIETSKKCSINEEDARRIGVRCELA